MQLWLPNADFVEISKGEVWAYSWLQASVGGRAEPLLVSGVIKLASVDRWALKRPLGL